MNAVRRLAVLLLVAVGLAGCVAYEAVPVDPMEAPWRAAIGAVEDAGLTLATVDRPTGTIRGRGRTDRRGRCAPNSSRTRGLPAC